MISNTGNAKHAAANGHAETAPTSQALTHYHSMVYSLLSWERPRSTAISFATVVGMIIAGRYLPLLRWALKFLYMILGITASLEIGGRLIFSRGLASSSRPRKYYTIPKDTIGSVLEDLEQLVDFFLIEFQRIIFAENLAYTITAFTAALNSYWLVMVLPLWGLALMGTCVVYLGPLVYFSNKEFIDNQVEAIQELINSQASQVKEMAGVQTAHATDIVKQYVGDYSAKATDLIGSSRTPAASPEPETVPVIKKEEPTQEPTPEPTPEPSNESSREQIEVKHSAFPEAPKDEPLVDLKEEEQSPELISAS